MEKLVDILLSSGLVTEAQVEVTRQKQRVFGGSLALHLLADGLVPERALQTFLDQIHGTSSTECYDQDPEPELLGLLTSEQAGRLRAIPLREKGGKIQILAANPSDEEVRTELERLLPGRELELLPVNELRLLWLLDRWYGIPCPAPIARAAERLFEAKRSSPRPDEPAEDGLLYDPLAGSETSLGDMALFAAAGPGTAPEEEDIVPILDSELPLLIIEEDAPQTVSPAEPEIQPLDPEGLDGALEQASSLEDIYSVLLRFARRQFTAVAAFKVQAGSVTGWRAYGQGVDQERFAGFSAPVGTGVLLSPASGEGIVLLATRTHPVDEQLARILGVGPQQVLVSDAVAVSGRAVLVLSGAVRPDANPDDAAAEFHVFCTKASEAVLRIIIEKKRRRQRPQPQG